MRPAHLAALAGIAIIIATSIPRAALAIPHANAPETDQTRDTLLSTGTLLRIGHGALGVEPLPRLDRGLELRDARGARGDVVLDGGAAFCRGRSAAGGRDGRELSPPGR